MLIIYNSKTFLVFGFSVQRCFVVKSKIGNFMFIKEIYIVILLYVSYSYYYIYEQYVQIYILPMSYIVVLYLHLTFTIDSIAYIA